LVFDDCFDCQLVSLVNRELLTRSQDG